MDWPSGGGQPEVVVGLATGDIWYYAAPPTTSAGYCGTCTSSSDFLPAVNCTGFYQCTSDDGDQPIYTACSDGLLFNQDTMTCDWSDNVQCSCMAVQSPSTWVEVLEKQENNVRVSSMQCTFKSNSNASTPPMRLVATLSDGRALYYPRTVNCSEPVFIQYQNITKPTALQMTAFSASFYPTGTYPPRLVGGLQPSAQFQDSPADYCFESGLS